jgi:hypothetical protein
MEMSTKAIAPRLADRLCSLAESQLQTQVSRSGTLDAGALGVVSACVAVATIVLGVRSAHHLWIAALALLTVSVGIAVRALFLPGAERIGPLVADVLDARQARDDQDLEQTLLDDLATETLANEHALRHKNLLLTEAVMLFVLALALELVGVQ